jgi:DNA-binding transcriptional MerR regulator
MEQMPGNQVASDEPLYNIGVVSRMTGISVATLRAWERRYGYPTLGRTVGGHRLYSEKDVINLRWIKGQIDEGLQTAQAIHMLRNREERAAQQAGLGQPPGALPESVLLPGKPGNGQPAERAVPGTLADMLDLRGRLWNALLAYDTAAADQVMGDALLTYSLDDLIFRVIEPVFNEIGRGWEEGKITVAMEHLTTHYLRHRLLMWMLGGPPLYPARPVVLACAPGELHEGSLLILGALLRRRRWPVAYLGQTVPLADLASLVREVQPPAVVLVAMTEGSAAQLADWPRYLPDAAETGRPVLAFGGRIFSEQPEWRERVPGMFLGETLEEGLDRLDSLLQKTIGMPAGHGTEAGHG